MLNSFEEYSKCKNDFVYFVANYVKITHPKRGLIPFELYGYQKRIADTYENKSYVLIKKFRQGGITTFTVIWLLWKAMFFDNQVIFCAAKTEREAIHIGKIVALVLGNLPSWLMPRMIKDNENEKEFAFTNSKMWFYNMEVERSRNLTYLFIDDAAFIPSMDDKWEFMYPCVMGGGKVFVASTTNGIGNWFEKTWHESLEGKNMFTCLEIDYHEHPDYNNQAWVDEMRKNLGERSFRQEVLCEFLGEETPEDELAALERATQLSQKAVASSVLRQANSIRKKHLHEYACLMEAYKRLSLCKCSKEDFATCVFY